MDDGRAELLSELITDPPLGIVDSAATDSPWAFAVSLASQLGGGRYPAHTFLHLKLGVLLSLASQVCREAPARYATSLEQHNAVPRVAYPAVRRLTAGPALAALFAGSGAPSRAAGGRWEGPRRPGAAGVVLAAGGPRAGGGQRGGGDGVGARDRRPHTGR